MSKPGNTKRHAPPPTVVTDGGTEIHQIGEMPPGVRLTDKVPAKRGDCEGHQRPHCTPGVYAYRCTHAIATTTPIDRPGRYRAGGSLPMLVDTSRLFCALDFAARGGMTSAEIAKEVYGKTRRAIELVSQRAADKVLLAAARDAELAEDFGADEVLTVRIRPKEERVTEVQTSKPTPFARVALYVKIGDRDVSLDLDGDQSTNLLRMLREAKVGCLRGLARTIRDAMIAAEPT